MGKLTFCRLNTGFREKFSEKRRHNEGRRQNEGILQYLWRELLEDMPVVDTSQDMKPIKFKDVHGDKSDLICIECAAESVENPPFLCSRCGQPIEFGEHFYVLRLGTLKPGGPKVNFKDITAEDKCICTTCFEEFINPEEDEEKRLNG